jgi:hypothetical protein
LAIFSILTTLNDPSKPKIKMNRKSVLEQSFSK